MQVSYLSCHSFIHSFSSFHFHYHAYLSLQGVIAEDSLLPSLSLPLSSLSFCFSLFFQLRLSSTMSFFKHHFVHVSPLQKNISFFRVAQSLSKFLRLAFTVFLHFLPCLFQLYLSHFTSLNRILQLERSTHHPLDDCCTFLLPFTYSYVPLFCSLKSYILSINYMKTVR